MNNAPNNPNNPRQANVVFNGMSFFASDFISDAPRMQLSPALSAILEPHHVAYFNNWLRDFFGVSDGTIVIPGANTAFVSHKTLAKIRSMISNTQ